MPRVKCSFCDTLVTVKPYFLNQEGFFPKCMTCNQSIPPDEWRCQAKCGTASRHKIRGWKCRVKGERCSNWVSRKGYKYCGVHYHKKKRDEKNEKA